MKGALRIAAAFAVVSAGFFVFAGFTTQYWGLTGHWVWRSIGTVLLGGGVAAVVLAPLAWIPFAGWPWPRMLIGMAAIGWLAVLSAEVFARAQEWVVIRTYGPSPAQSIHLERWWPCESHGLGYSPERGWQGWD